MTTTELSKGTQRRANGTPEQAPGGEAVYAGLALIMAKAALSHLRAGDVDMARSCVEEAERFMTWLSNLN